VRQVNIWSVALTILEFFHLIQVVDDEDEVDRFYDRLFAPQPVMSKHFSEQEKRWASLGMVSDLMIEVIEPSSDPADQDMPLTKFRARHGPHFHSYAWYVAPTSVKPLFGRLRQAAVRVTGPGGAVYPPGDVDPGNTIFTHPKDTFGQLEFEGKRDHWRQTDPRFSDPWTTAPWSEGPLTIQHLSHMTTMVRDLARASHFYTEVLGGQLFHETSATTADSAFVLVGADTVVELACPRVKETRLSDDLARHGEMPHSATFLVRDLEAAERYVETLGIGVTDRAGESFTLDPDGCFGGVWSFTDSELPRDPRAARRGNASA
jgi:catechol 2,3-dioxygenase-like lactoylglutathione lyase family enzyme